MNKMILLLLIVSFNCLSSSAIGASSKIIIRDNITQIIGFDQVIMTRDSISKGSIDTDFLSHQPIRDKETDVIMNFIEMLNGGHDDGHVDGYDDGYDQ